MKKLLFYSSVCLLMILFYGCTHQEGNLPKVKTGNVFFTSYSHFVAGGLVEANESGIMKFGFCWSTTNKKPDINDAHCDEINDPTIATYYTPIGGSEHQAFFGGGPIFEDESPASLNTTLYVRAYAMTAEGKYVYGKTVSCTMGNENTPWGILVRPANGWILQSSSAEGNYPDHITVDDGVAIFWIYSDELDFIHGSSEFLPDPSRIDIWKGCKLYGEILNLTKNELRIKTRSGSSCAAGIELTYVPAP